MGKGGQGSSRAPHAQQSKFRFLHPQPVPADSRLKLYTMDEVAKHDDKDDLWLVIDDLVYDATRLYTSHPGGNVIATWAGRDASDVFRVWHLPEVRKRLTTYLIGRVPPPQRTSQYETEKRALFEHVEKSGLYELSVSWYVQAFVIPYALIALGAASPFLTGNFWLLMLGAVTLAEGWHQLAFIGHDMLHNQILRVPNQALAFGVMIGTLSMGITGSWWKYTHNMHHATVNEWERDPDITHMPLIGVTSKMFMHKRSRKLAWYEELAMKLFVPFQHLLYLPIMIFSRFNLYIQGILLLIKGEVPTMPGQKYHHGLMFRFFELKAVITFLCWTNYLFYYVSVLHDTPTAIWFFVACHLYSGVLGVQITLSHWDRPMHSLLEKGDRETGALTFTERPGIDGPGTVAAQEHGHVNDEHEWVFQQSTTGHNIDNSKFIDYYFGGLNYQIEHHILPGVPRHNLGELKKLVEPFCERWGIPYQSSHPVGALMSLMRSMRSVAEQVQYYDMVEEKVAKALEEKKLHDAQRAAERASRLKAE